MGQSLRARFWFHLGSVVFGIPSGSRGPGSNHVLVIACGFAAAKPSGNNVMFLFGAAKCSLIGPPGRQQVESIAKRSPHTMVLFHVMRRFRTGANRGTPQDAARF